MNSRRKFIRQGSLGTISLFSIPLFGLSPSPPEFEGLVVGDQEGESLLMRDGTSIVRIKVSKAQGAESICFLSESFRPGDALPVHKHMNEDELIFLHKGAGLFTLGDTNYEVSEGTAMLISRGIWHGLKNTGTQNIEMRMAYTPSGFEGFFREVGTPVGQHFVKKSMEERTVIAKKWGMIYKE